MPTDPPPFSRSIATHAVTGLVSGAVVLAASAMLATKAPSGEPVKVKAPEIGPMVVSKLIVMDGKGRARITLSSSDDGPTIELRGQTGKPMAIIAASDAEGMNNYAVFGLADPVVGKTVAITQHHGIGEVLIERPSGR